MSRLQDRGGYGGVGAASANIPAHPLGDLFSRRRGVFQTQRLGSHDLTGRATAALPAAVADKRVLEWI